MRQIESAWRMKEWVGPITCKRDVARFCLFIFFVIDVFFDCLPTPPPPAVNMKIQLFFLPKYLCTEVRRPRLSSSEYVQLGVHFGQSGGGSGQCPLVASE